MPKPTELRPQGQVASPTEDMVEEGEPCEPRREEWHTSIIGMFSLLGVMDN
jgi:hypothetical protein